MQRSSAPRAAAAPSRSTETSIPPPLWRFVVAYRQQLATGGPLTGRPHHDTRDPRQVGACLDRAEARFEQHLAHRRRLTGADLEADDRGDAGCGRDRGAQHVEAVGPGEQRLARLPLGHLRLQLRPFPLADVGQVGNEQVEARRLRQHRLDEAHPLGQAEPHRRWRARPRAPPPRCRSRSPRSPAARRRSPARPRPSRCRCRARARGRSSSASSTSSSVSGRGISTRRIDRQLDRAEPFAADDVGERLAPQPPPHHLAEPPRRVGGHLDLGIGREPRPVPSRRLAEQQLSVEARVFDSGGAQSVGGSVRLPERCSCRSGGHAKNLSR